MLEQLQLRREVFDGAMLRERFPQFDADGGWLDVDLVADDEFILGAVPGAPGLCTGVGWRGTGYKFAPWVGLVLAQLALQQGTGYDIRRFSPGRFAAQGKVA